MTAILAAVAGVRDCRVDLATELADIDDDPTVATHERLVQVVREAGWDNGIWRELLPTTCCSSPGQPG